jgi:hypothetical protein
MCLANYREKKPKAEFECLHFIPPGQEWEMNLVCRQSFNEPCSYLQFKRYSSERLQAGISKIPLYGGVDSAQPKTGWFIFE